MSRLVRELMHPGVMTCKPDTPLGEVARMLDERHIHALFVTENGAQIQGVITDFDLLAGEWLSEDPQSLAVMREMTAGELMSSPVAMIEAGAPASEAARRMDAESIRRLLVIEGDKPVGVISVTDLLHDLGRQAIKDRKAVGDVMSDAMLVCRDKTPITAAARAMVDSGWRSVLVVNASGKPLGFFSGLDLLAYCQVEECTDNMTVSEIMHPALTITMAASLREAANMMIQNHHHRLVVVDPDQPESVPLGVISSFDIVAEMARPGSVWQEPIR